MPLPEYTLVVAKYNEDMGWLCGMDASRIVVYDKGSSSIPQAHLLGGVCALDNVGRESESYIHHVVSNYDRLTDYLVFVQGNPFEHMKGVTPNTFQEALDRELSKRPNQLLPLFTEWYNEPHDQYRAIKAKEYFEDMFIDRPAAKSSIFATGCQYIVPRHDIVCKPLEFYKGLHTKILKGETCHSEAHDGRGAFDPSKISAWSFERIAPYVFGRYHPRL